jgi:hypothetical protein
MEASAVPERWKTAVEQGLLRPASMVSVGSSKETMRRFLRLLRQPAVGCLELRVLRAVRDQRGEIRRARDVEAQYAGATMAG